MCTHLHTPFWLIYFLLLVIIIISWTPSQNIIRLMREFKPDDRQLGFISPAHTPTLTSTRTGLTRCAEKWVPLLSSRGPPVSQRQCAAGVSQLQRAPLHRAPLADGLVGPVHGGLVHPGRQHVGGSAAGRRRLLLGGDADAQGHLRPGQRGPSSPQKVGPATGHLTTFPQNRLIWDLRDSFIYELFQRTQVRIIPPQFCLFLARSRSCR